MLILLLIGFGRSIVFIDGIFDWIFGNLDCTEIQNFEFVPTNKSKLFLQ